MRSGVFVFPQISHAESLSPVWRVRELPFPGAIRSEEKTPYNREQLSSKGSPKKHQVKSQQEEATCEGESWPLPTLRYLHLIQRSSIPETMRNMFVFAYTGIWWHFVVAPQGAQCTVGSWESCSSKRHRVDGYISHT